MNWEGIAKDGNEKNQRKFQCFVCGQIFSEYPEYKTHIVDNHEEGREYVICPLDHCQAPVRDVRLHVKTKHPHFDIKQLGSGYQAKAVVWHDFSSKGQKKTRRPTPRTGRYTSLKCGKCFHYRSGLEEQVYGLLDEDMEVMAYDVEPFQIDYIWKGQAHKYIPDIIVIFQDGHKEVWEVKPASQTEYDQNQAKWKAAEEACRIRGWGWQVYTEQRIDKLRKKVRSQRLE